MQVGDAHHNIHRKDRLTMQEHLRNYMRGGDIFSGGGPCEPDITAICFLGHEVMISLINDGPYEEYVRPVRCSLLGP